MKSEITNVKISIVEEFDAFLALERQWNRLLGESVFNTVFLTHQWFTEFIAAFGLKERLCVVLLHHNSDLIGILPLYHPPVKYSGLKLRLLKSITNDHSQKYCFILKSGWEFVYPQILWQLRERLPWDLIQTDFVSADTFMFRQSAGPAQGNLSIKQVAWMQSPKIELDGDWDSYYRGGFSKSLRKKIDRLTRKAQKQFDLSYEILGGKRLTPQDLHEAFAIEDSGWKGKDGSSILKNPAVQKFYECLAESMNGKGWFELRFLKFSHQRVAFEYSLKYNRHDNSLKAGYDATLSQFSAGHILTKFSIKTAFEKNMRVYDLLGQADSYKLRMANSVEPLYRLYHFNSSAASKALQFIRFGAKDMAEKAGLKEPVKQLWDGLRPLLQINRKN